MLHVFIIKPGHLEIENIIKEVMVGHEYLILRTKGPRDTSKLAGLHQSPQNRIYVIGGDGMLHEAIQQLVNTKTGLVIIPYGTGNDFARNFSISGDIKEEIVRSLELQGQDIDVFKANDIYCANTLAFAIDSDCANHVHDQKIWKILPGSIYYAKTMVQRLVNFKGFTAKLSIGDQEISNRFIIGAIANGRYYGGGFKIGEGKVNDGMIELIAVAGSGKIKAVTTLLKLALGGLIEDQRAIRLTTNQMTLQTEREINIDGETYPAGTYRINVIPRGLRVINELKNP